MMPGNPTHFHHSEYADPIMRVPSPTSSVGTTYPPDATSYSDSEFQLSDAAFAKKCEDAVALNFPRQEEIQADRDPLLSLLVMVSLREEVAQLRENELFEQILLRGSKAALDVQPTTNDIDLLMKSMMGPGLKLTSGPHMGKSEPPPDPSNPAATSAPSIADGPWNNWGQPSEAERRYSLLSTEHMHSGTTVGKRSRNGTARKA
ncbi:hypothetical protein BDN70DRAFT_911179 [Pholiota conissans]|uniref:Uncharacterized protein n=1 Tax=Pholiota conissans TaxID=109636 RepID=A0A9P5Z8U1_9AGAR|nr:hypothetical protein BDN70DRAFT_911179 [Pholiota conissans]